MLQTVEQPNPERERRELEARLKSIVYRLEKDAEDCVNKKKAVEDRALSALRQYHGRYDEDTEGRLRANPKKSKIFLNLTQPKTDAWSSRISDLMIPTDDRNWAIAPTPVPRLADDAKVAAKAALALSDQAKAAREQAGAEGADPNAMQQAMALQEQAEAAQAKASELRTVIDEARKRSDLMSEQIDDQLQESQYYAVIRDVIDDACKIGTGVCKGPVSGDRVRRGWKQKPVLNEMGQPVIGNDGNPVMGEYALEMSSGDDNPAIRYVDFWSFFPKEARKVDEAEGVFERHLMTKKRLRALAQLPGFSEDAIRKLLKADPSKTLPSYLAQLRDISSANEQMTSDLYQVWEYHGALSADDMRDIAEAMGDDATLDDLEDVDPLTEQNAIVWFCQGELLRFAIHPYDSGECIYSVFNFVKDEASIFGYGVPDIVNPTQRSAAAAWRAMMDNAGLTTGPQIVIDQDQLEPANGSWDIEPMKVWRTKVSGGADKRAFDAFNIPTMQAELAAIVDLSKKYMDETVQLPMIAQGEQGTGVTKTAQGMAILMNSANVIFRRVVKNFDDDVTTPLIRRYYDWNMQFNPKKEIKGDYEVSARGSSVLLVREMQAQNLMTLAMALGTHPKFAMMLKDRDMLKMIFKAHMIPTDEVLLSEEEIEAALTQAQAQQDAMAQAAQMDGKIKQEELALKRDTLDANIAMEEMRMHQAIKVAELARETQMMKMAETMNMKLDEINADLEKARMANESKERLLAGEAAMAQRTGQQGAGGGYV